MEGNLAVAKACSKDQQAITKRNNNVTNYINLHSQNKTLPAYGLDFLKINEKLSTNYET